MVRQSIPVYIGRHSPNNIVSLRPFILLCLSSLIAVHAQAQSIHRRFLEPGSISALPPVVANDNRAPAGTFSGDTLNLSLEVVWGDWRIETPEGPGLRVAAIAESGGPPMIPAPLIRVETGTTIHIRLSNGLADSSIVAFGFQTRPAQQVDSLVVRPTDEGAVIFEAGEPGTYFYAIRLGQGFDPDFDEREQLAGAFIVDPPGGSEPDRVFVMNIFSTPIDTAAEEIQWLEALTINGLSWPYTERQRPAVGDTLRWRVINPSGRNHPMHLHGFYYDVLSRGSMLEDDIYELADARKVVTEFMFFRTTMLMQWVATRPGKWLFHCHLSFHISPEIRLPMADAVEGHHDEPHMAGLVLGIDVAEGLSDLIFEGEPRHIRLYALEFPEDTTYNYAFSLDPSFLPDSMHLPAPGPILELRQYQPTFVTVENRMSIPTGVHWHGLELDSWADGVPGWSSSDGRVSPVIMPGETFTYKLALMRPGTFIYHSHLDDVHQLTGGLYGPLLVLAKGETRDEATDHVYTVGWKIPELQSIYDAELNGRHEQPAMNAVVGETHRLRVINIAPAGQISVHMKNGDAVVKLKLLAKDGADLPARQQVEVEKSPVYGVGETADFGFTPTEPGIYTLEISYPEAGWTQTWHVTQGDPVEQ